MIKTPFQYHELNFIELLKYKHQKKFKFWIMLIHIIKNLIKYEYEFHSKSKLNFVKKKKK